MNFQLESVSPSQVMLMMSALLLLISFLTGCQSLPEPTGETSFKLPTNDTQLAQKVSSGNIPEGHNAFHLLSEGTEAFAARIAMIRLAEKTVDLQYYIWAPDETGNMLKTELLQAADRGVRVRLLLDDIGHSAKDPVLLALHKHPNIEVKLFNPIADRNKRLTHLAANFSRIQRRMHNKSLTADNALSVIGGRNIGNEYFDAYANIEFADLDILVAGKIVDQITDSFDLYWNYHVSYPIDVISKEQLSDSDTRELLNHLRDAYNTALASSYTQRLEQTEFARGQDSLTWHTGKLSLLFDHPAKAEATSHANGEQQYMVDQLPAAVGDIKKEVLVISAYFIPGKKGVEYFKSLTDNNIDVIVVTNSLSATDVEIVHASYAKYRKPLLKAGVKIFELRALEREFGFDEDEKSQRKSSGYKFYQSSRASLHAKSFFFDREKTFITSMNFDPRSFDINTELGILIEQAAFTEDAVLSTHESLTRRAYQLSLSKQGKLLWHSLEDDGSLKTHTSEPNTGWFKRVAVWFMAWLPIERFL